MKEHCPYCGRFLRVDKIDEGTEYEEVIGLTCTTCMKLYAEPDYDGEWYEYDLKKKVSKKIVVESGPLDMFGGT